VKKLKIFLRKYRLIDQNFTLADDGWQIIYQTMDNNIRDTFVQKGLVHPAFQEIVLIKM